MTEQHAWNPEEPLSEGGSRRGRPSVEFYVNRHEDERMRVNLSYDKALQIASGDHEAGMQLLRLIEDNVRKMERGEWKRRAWEKLG